MKFKFQVQDSFLEYLEILRFEKRIALSENKPPLGIFVHGEIKEEKSSHNPSNAVRWDDIMNFGNKIKKKDSPHQENEICK